MLHLVAPCGRTPPHPPTPRRGGTRPAWFGLRPGLAARRELSRSPLAQVPGAVLNADEDRAAAGSVEREGALVLLVATGVVAHADLHLGDTRDLVVGVYVEQDADPLMG